MGILERARRVFEPPYIRVSTVKVEVGYMHGNIFFSYKPVKYNSRCDHCNEPISRFEDRWAASVVTVSHGTPLTETTVRCKKCMDFLTAASSVKQEVDKRFEEVREQIRREGQFDKNKTTYSIARVSESDGPRVYVPKAGEWNPSKPVE